MADLRRVTRPASVAIDGGRLRELRGALGLSQQELACRAGVSLTTAGRLEREPDPACRGWTVGRLAAVLGTEPAGLCHSVPALLPVQFAVGSPAGSAQASDL
jgi:DNA-binding XRE family transcriptional regulator